jgi:hypothetical protein
MPRANPSSPRSTRIKADCRSESILYPEEVVGSNPTDGASRRSSMAERQKPLANPSSALNSNGPAAGRESRQIGSLPSISFDGRSKPALPQTSSGSSRGPVPTAGVESIVTIFARWDHPP